MPEDTSLEQQLGRAQTRIGRLEAEVEALEAILRELAVAMLTAPPEAYYGLAQIAAHQYVEFEETFR